MSREEAERVMSVLSQDEPWQFQQTVSSDQSHMAKSYLESLGFELELIPSPGLSPNESKEQSAVAITPERTSWFKSLFKRSTREAGARAGKEDSIIQTETVFQNKAETKTNEEKSMLITNINASSFSDRTFLSNPEKTMIVPPGKATALIESSLATNTLT